MRKDWMRRQNHADKKGKSGWILCFAAAFTFTAACTVFAAAGTADSAGRGPAAEIEQRANGLGQNANGVVYNGDVNTLKAAQETERLILAVGNPEDPAKTTVSYYERGENGALQQVFSVPAVSGMNGISPDKVEGDKKTPEGLYSFTMAFGMEDDPGSILPYHKVAAGDYFVDDGNSRYYNRLVNENEVARDWSTGENLIRQAPHYNYALVLNYNDSYIPGKGSAIFLHCPKVANNTGTSGCISVPEEYAKELVRRVDANTKILVVPDEKSLAGY